MCDPWGPPQRETQEEEGGLGLGVQRVVNFGPPKDAGGSLRGPGILWVPGGVAGVQAWTGGTVPSGGCIRATCAPSSGVLRTRRGVSRPLVRQKWTVRGLSGDGCL